MPEIANRIDHHEAALVRWIAATGQPPAESLYAYRIFEPADGPIRYVEASGRARCRECGEPIAKGERAVVFGFDARATSETSSSWGRLAAAYVHAEECLT